MCRPGASAGPSESIPGFGKDGIHWRCQSSSRRRLGLHGVTMAWLTGGDIPKVPQVYNQYLPVKVYGSKLTSSSIPKYGHVSFE